MPSRVIWAHAIFKSTAQPAQEDSAGSRVLRLTCHVKPSPQASQASFHEIMGIVGVLRHVRKLQSCVAHAIPTTTFAAMPAYVTRRAEAARQQAPEIRNSETQTILARVYHFVFVPIVLIIL